MNFDTFWKYAKNTTKTIYILFLIGIGIKLLWLVIFSFIPYKSFSPFEQPDWNPVATLVGAIITAGVTFCAVFLTSKQDRDARKEEKKYDIFISLMLDLDGNMSYLHKVLDDFYVNPKVPLNYEHRPEIENNDIKKTYSVYKTIKKMEQINLKWNKQNFSNLIFELHSIQNSYFIELHNVQKIPSYVSEVFTIEEDGKTYYSLTKLLNMYEKNTKHKFDSLEITEKLNNMQDLINKELKMDEK